MTDDERAAHQVAGYMSTLTVYADRHPASLLYLAREIVAVVRTSDDEWESDQ